jgi:hypothetical protein
MSLTVQQYVERLERAAQANRDLFISSIRAFAAAIDAKDPTRGPRRVADLARSIVAIGAERRFQRIWIGAAHDVGRSASRTRC